MLDPIDAWNPFDRLIERDSTAYSRPVITFLSHESQVPVVLQETGFPEHLPCGRGLFAVENSEQAASAIEAIRSDYRLHANAAMEIARDCRDSPKVLGRLLSSLNI